MAVQYIYIYTTWKVTWRAGVFLCVQDAVRRTQTTPYVIYSRRLVYIYIHIRQKQRHTGNREFLDDVNDLASIITQPNLQIGTYRLCVLLKPRRWLLALVISIPFSVLAIIWVTMHILLSSTKIERHLIYVDDSFGISRQQAVIIFLYIPIVVPCAAAVCGY